MKKHILISFLGKARKKDSEYEKTSYDFDGVKKQGSYFGLLAAQQYKCDKLVILGTVSSMWEFFAYEALETVGENLYEKIDHLVKNAKVSQSYLDELAKKVAEYYQIELEMKIIAMGKTTAEQQEILKTMIDVCSEKDDVTLDITHGFRHLGMISMMSAIILRQGLNITVKDILYGAFDMKLEDVAPVISLKYLLDISDWTQSLKIFEDTGNMAALAKPLKDVKEVDLAKNITDLQYKLDTMQIDQKGLKESVIKIRKDLNKNHDGVMRLMSGGIEKRMPKENAKIWEVRRAEAYKLIEFQDYRGAATVGFEAFVEFAGLALGGEPKTRGYDRQEELKSRVETQLPAEFKDKYEEFRKIRNAFAHADGQKRDILAIIQKPAELKRTLQTFLQETQPWWNPEHYSKKS